MENKFNNIDEIFAKSLGDHSVDPPASIWDNIQGQLDSPGSSHQIDKVFEKGLGKHTKQPPSYVWDNIRGTLDLVAGRRRRIIGWVAGSVAAIVIAFIGGYFISNNIASTKNKQNSAVQKITSSHQVNIDINRFWNLDGKVFGSPAFNGHTYFSIIPGEVNNDISPNNGNRYNYGNPNDVDTDPGNFGTRTNHDHNNNGNGQRDDSDHQPESNGNKPQDEVETNDLAPVINNDDDNSDSNNEVEDDNNGSDNDNPNLNNIEVNNSIDNVDNTLIETVINNNDTESPLVNGHNEEVNDGSNSNEESTNDKVEDVNNVQNDAQADINKTENSILSNQDEKEEPKMVKSGTDESPTTFTILPYFSPTYTFRNSRMNNTGNLQSAFDTLGNFNGFSETTNFSYSAGLLVGYNFTPRLTVFIGAAYNSFSNTTSRNDVASLSFNQVPVGESTPMVTSAGTLGNIGIVPTQGTPETPTYIVQDHQVGLMQNGEVKRVTQTFSYVEVPVLVRYRLFGPKIGLIFTGGLSTGFLVRNEVLAESDIDSKIFGETNNIRNFSMNATIGVGLEAQLLPFMYLNIEPTFKYSFVNWSIDQNFSMNPISIGLNTGLAFKF